MSAEVSISGARILLRAPVVDEVEIAFPFSAAVSRRAIVVDCLEAEVESEGISFARVDVRCWFTEERATEFGGRGVPRGVTVSTLGSVMSQ